MELLALIIRSLSGYNQIPPDVFLGCGMPFTRGIYGGCGRLKYLKYFQLSVKITGRFYKEVL
jgi:hypothetical protein